MLCVYIVPGSCNYGTYPIGQKSVTVCHSMLVRSSFAIRDAFVELYHQHDPTMKTALV